MWEVLLRCGEYIGPFLTPFGTEVERRTDETVFECVLCWFWVGTGFWFDSGFTESGFMEGLMLLLLGVGSGFLLGT